MWREIYIVVSILRHSVQILTRDVNYYSHCPWQLLHLMLECFKQINFDG